MGRENSMIESIAYTEPEAYSALKNATELAGFTMPSEYGACSLLRTLAASKPGGRFLELGTGTGLSTAWILDGMDAGSTLVSLDHAQDYLDIAAAHLGSDERLNLICSDGEAWIRANEGQRFDFIFADTWHGKYLMLDETLAMLNPGGLYIIDDMLPQQNWPEGHAAKVSDLIRNLEMRAGFTLTKMDWSSGIILGVKTAL